MGTPAGGWHGDMVSTRGRLTVEVMQWSACSGSGWVMAVLSVTSISSQIRKGRHKGGRIGRETPLSHTAARRATAETLPATAATQHPSTFLHN